MKIEIKLPAPHSDIQKQIMTAFETPHLLELWIACGTKFGKTLGMSVAACYSAPRRNGNLFRWVAPIFPQAMIGWRYCLSMLPPKPYIEPNKGLHTITIPGAGNTRIEFRSGENPESLEGEASNGNILDEASKMKLEQVYASVKTTTTVTKGPIVPISTPRGKNFFFKKCMEAQDRMEWALKRGKPLTHIFLTAPSTANPLVTADVIEEARRTLPDRLFRQYYLAEFVDDADVFTGYRSCLYGQPIEEDGRMQFWIWDGYEEKDNKANVHVVVGADWGKNNDFTVLTAWDYTQKRLCAFLRFRGLSYVHAIKYLIWFCEKFKQVEMIYHDKTGLGEVMDDMLAQTALPFEGVVFSNKSKSYMVNALMLAIEQRLPLLPNWGEMRREMDAFEVSTNDIGTMSYSAASGMHDDIVASMILGWAGVLEYSGTLEVSTLEDLPKGDSKIITNLNWYDDDENDLPSGYREIKLPGLG